MIKHLKNLENNLRPYKFFTATFLCEGVQDPVLVKILFNDFNVVPEFTCSYVSTGYYTVVLRNFDKLNINSTDNVGLDAEIIYCGSSQRIEGYLSEDHATIKLAVFEPSFGSLSDLAGIFTITYYKIN